MRLVSFFIFRPVKNNRLKFVINVDFYKLLFSLVQGNNCYTKLSKYEVHTISFQTFFIWALLLIVHT